MRMMGQICLLSAFVLFGYSAFAGWFGTRREQRGLIKTGQVCAATGFVALTVTMGVLGWALWIKDFGFSYVAQYSSQTLETSYSLSALWVGQAGSLLLWVWMLAVVAFAFRFWPVSVNTHLREPAFAILMANCAFLTGTMLFAADPMQANLAPGQEGAGLSPLLQHPAMLIHPPIVFLGYAMWAVPCSVAIAALVFLKPGRNLSSPFSETGSRKSPTTVVDVSWVSLARPWSLMAWTTLGSGILLGAYWSYQELGWGGYWAWDPVENGSLLPWLIGSALIHTLMGWQFRGVFKKVCVALAVAVLAFCNFATFLTRSGIFSSLHAFSQSPIGWLFLGLMLTLAVVGIVLVVKNAKRLQPDNLLSTVWARESMVLISLVALLLLAAVTLVGTLSLALSEFLVGRRIIIGPEFYNHVLIPIGLVLLLTMGAAPLLRWGLPPTLEQRRALLVSAGVASLAALIGWLVGLRHWLAISVAWLTGFAIVALLASLALEWARRRTNRSWRGLLEMLSANRRTYAGFVIHMGFVCTAIGITGSSLGSQRNEVVMRPGESIQWAGSSFRFQQLNKKDRPGGFIVEAELQISSHTKSELKLFPARHFHHLQQQWTTEVAIYSDWAGDLYTILHDPDIDDAVRLTLVKNPLMRWMWMGGWLMIAGTLIRLVPNGRRKPDRRLPVEMPITRQQPMTPRKPVLIPTSVQHGVAPKPSC